MIHSEKKIRGKTFSFFSEQIVIFPRIFLYFFFFDATPIKGGGLRIYLECFHLETYLMPMMLHTQNIVLFSTKQMLDPSGNPATSILRSVTLLMEHPVYI
jgi:hypothetical protein